MSLNIYDKENDKLKPYTGGVFPSNIPIYDEEEEPTEEALLVADKLGKYTEDDITGLNENLNELEDKIKTFSEFDLLAEYNGADGWSQNIKTNHPISDYTFIIITNGTLNSEIYNPLLMPVTLFKSNIISSRYYAGGDATGSSSQYIDDNTVKLRKFSSAVYLLGVK